MNEPKQIELFAQQPYGVSKRTVEYVPPDAATIKEYAFEVCTLLDLAQEGPKRSEIANDLNSFLVFVGDRTAKYMNNGYRDFLLKGYKKRKI